LHIRPKGSIKTKAGKTATKRTRNTLGVSLAHEQGTPQTFNDWGGDEGPGQVTDHPEAASNSRKGDLRRGSASDRNLDKKSVARGKKRGRSVEKVSRAIEGKERRSTGKGKRPAEKGMQEFPYLETLGHQSRN